MSTRKTVDELSIEELEAIIAARKREARRATLRRLHDAARVIDVSASKPPVRSTVEADGHLRSRRKTWRDRLLLLLEIAVVIGLVWVVIGVEQTRQELNQDVAFARGAERPTPEPTPLIGAVVLPDGHKPPTAPGGPAPNFDEIPAHLRAYVQSITPVPIPTPGPSQPTRIQISAINVDSVIVHGTDWEQLKKGVGHYLGSANPGERGNLVLAAHNDVYGEWFRDLDQLEPGDEVIVDAGTQRYRYVITSSRVVEPTAVEVMAPTSSPTLTLISCYPYLIDTQRIVVFADLQS